jgi:hypothetical protein
MDFSQARYSVDGIYPYIFAVRDLASHRQLAWQPVASEKADEVLRVLADLIREHGAPLVLKSDNGSALDRRGDKIDTGRDGRGAALFSRGSSTIQWGTGTFQLDLENLHPSAGGG